MTRYVSWFSCGAASAVATKLAITSGKQINVVYCEVVEEHSDNKRFLSDCEKWFGQKIEIIGNDEYDRSIYKVFEKVRYLKGPQSVACTGRLKKHVREQYQKPDDVQVFGYTVEEQQRVDRFIDANNDVQIWPILIENGLSKSDCLSMIDRAGIELPAMYQMGYRNNNCIGCVKGGAGYWNKIRQDFPDVFAKMSAVEDMLGRTVCKIEWVENGQRKLKRVKLKDLPTDAGNYPKEPDVECGIFCHMAESEITSASAGVTTNKR